MSIFDIFLNFKMLLLTYERVEKMKVKCFDENTASELEGRVNTFLCTLNGDIMDIKFNVAIAVQGEDQIYCFSAMVIYCEKE